MVSGCRPRASSPTRWAATPTPTPDPVLSAEQVGRSGKTQSELATHREGGAHTRKDTLELGKPVNSPVTTTADLPEARASGILEIGKGTRGSQPTRRAAVACPSVVVDLAQVEVATAAPKSPSVVVPVQSTPTENFSDRITGEMQVVPSRKVVHQVRDAARITIQLDASLAAEQEKAAPTTKSTVDAMDDLKIEPTGARVTGEMQVTPSRKSLQHASRPASASSSFQIDPSLAAGTFSPVEKDFFAREAELYKVQKVEAFTDLEEKRAIQAEKHNTNGKGDRWNRK